MRFYAEIIKHYAIRYVIRKARYYKVHFIHRILL